MADDNLNEEVPASRAADDYETPAIEEVVTGEGLEREAAYAGQPAPSEMLP